MITGWQVGSGSKLGPSNERVPRRQSVAPSDARTRVSPDTDYSTMIGFTSGCMLRARTASGRTESVAEFLTHPRQAQRLTRKLKG